MDLAKQLVVRINVCKRMDKEVRQNPSSSMIYFIIKRTD